MSDKGTFSDFACRHEDENDAADSVMQWVLDKFNERAHPDHPATRENLLSNICYALALVYRARIVSTDADQWGAITAETWDFDYDTGAGFQTYIQCDDFEDGLALTYKAFYDKYGEERDFSAQDQAAHEAAMAEIAGEE